MSKRVTIFTGSRGEWGYLRPVLQLMRERGITFNIVIANMHLLPENGFTYREIERDGFEIAERVYMNINGPDDLSWPKSLGLLAFQLPDIYARLRTEILLLAGDRAETFMAASAAYYADIPIAHIQAGERSGHKDGMVRHAIGKLTHIHFASNEDAGDRLRRFGEQDFRIHVVGAPQLDDIKPERLMTRQEVGEKLGIELAEEFALCVVHPTSENPSECQHYMQWIDGACKAANLRQLWIYPNNDAGSAHVISEIERIATDKTCAFRNVNRRIYLSLLQHARVVIGNSSSGLLEAPTVRTAAINLGQRQQDRVAADSVINVPDVSPVSIAAAMDMLHSAPFQRRLQAVTNPYGDGNSAARIVEILETTVLDARMRNKFVQE